MPARAVGADGDEAIKLRRAQKGAERTAEQVDQEHIQQQLEGSFAALRADRDHPAVRALRLCVVFFDSPLAQAFVAYADAASAAQPMLKYSTPDTSDATEEAKAISVSLAP